MRNLINVLVINDHVREMSSDVVTYVMCVRYIVLVELISREIHLNWMSENLIFGFVCQQYSLSIGQMIVLYIAQFGIFRVLVEATIDLLAKEEPNLSWNEAKHYYLEKFRETIEVVERLGLFR
jgi:hypothetical protein